MKRSLSASLLFATAAVVGVAILAGCSHHAHLDKAAESHPKVMLPLDLSKGAPNELGTVPILEYHELTLGNKKAHAYQYPLVGFKADMERLYKLGYRPISLSDYVTGHIDVPAGRSPVVITFDDALRGQVDFDANGHLSPNCALGVLYDMHNRYPDWPIKATFFVLPMKGTEEYFYQKEYSQQKLQWLAQQGLELGNHTVHHLAAMAHWPDDKVQSEFAGAAALIDKYVPGYRVDLLALPYGIYPRNEKLVIKGESGGVKYFNICAMKAGYDPAPSPITPQFKPYRIPRIIPGNARFEIGWWLTELQKNKGERYISDGDPNTISVPESRKGDVMQARIKKDGLFFRTFTEPVVASDPLAGTSFAPKAHAASGR